MEKSEKSYATRLWILGLLETKSIHLNINIKYILNDAFVYHYTCYITLYRDSYSIMRNFDASSAWNVNGMYVQIPRTVKQNSVIFQNLAQFWRFEV